MKPQKKDYREKRIISIVPRNQTKGYIIDEGKGLVQF